MNKEEKLEELAFELAKQTSQITGDMKLMYDELVLVITDQLKFTNGNNTLHEQAIKRAKKIKESRKKLEVLANEVLDLTADKMFNKKMKG